MNQVEAFEVEGQIEVVGVNLPQDMEQNERLRAQQSKVSDVLVVLERHRESVEAALADRIATDLPEGIEARTTLSFADTGAAFNVNVLPVIEGDVRLDRRQFKSVLPGQVSSVISDYIGANATRVGVWEPKIVTAIKGQGLNGTSAGKSGGPSSGLGHIGWVLGAMGVGAGIVALMLMR